MRTGSHWSAGRLGRRWLGVDAGVDGGSRGGDGTVRRLGRQPERAEQNLSDLDLIPKAYDARVDHPQAHGEGRALLPESVGQRRHDLMVAFAGARVGVRGQAAALAPAHLEAYAADTHAILVDVTGLVIYFSVAALILRGTLL